MPEGYEVVNDKGERGWWDGKKITPLNESGLQVTGAGKQTEGERTAGFLSSRAADAARNLAEINARNPRASRPNLFEAAAAAADKPGIANFFRNADRQQVNVNQIDLLDAALTLGTGAAYTREQLEGQRAVYFPGLTDQPETAIHKRKKLLALLEAAKIKAGSAAPPILDQAINQMKVMYGEGPGASEANPFTLTEKNRSEIPEGAYFKAGDGQVYRHKRGAGYTPRKPASGGARPARELVYNPKTGELE